LAFVVTGCAKKEQARQQPTENRRLLIDGAVFLKQGDPKKAIENFANAIKTSPDDFEGYFMMGETFVRLKQYPQAVSVMSEAIRRFPKNGLAFYILASAYEGQGQSVPAILAARQSVELFNASGDKEAERRAMVLLGTLVSAAKGKIDLQSLQGAVKPLSGPDVVKQQSQ
jgi:predicted Zn-dependent protease